MRCNRNTQEVRMSAPVKEKKAPHNDDAFVQWPIVVDGPSVQNLETDNDIQYLVIPVKSKSGHKVNAHLFDSSDFEKKVRTFLLSVGLENNFIKIHSKSDKKNSHSKNKSELDIFKGFEDHRTRNEERKANLREYVLADAKWLDANQLSEKVGFENKNRSAGPSTWKRRNKIFAISYQGKNLYPRYCMDEAYQPLPIVKEILDIFDDTKSGWSLAFWFGTSNSWLGGAKPKDVLTNDKSQLIKAAKACKDGLQHG